MNKRNSLVSKMTDMAPFSHLCALTDRHELSDKQKSIQAVLGVKDLPFARQL